MLPVVLGLGGHLSASDKRLEMRRLPARLEAAQRSAGVRCARRDSVNGACLRGPPLAQMEFGRQLSALSSPHPDTTDARLLHGRLHRPQCSLKSCVGSQRRRLSCGECSGVMRNGGDGVHVGGAARLLPAAVCSNSRLKKHTKQTNWRYYAGGYRMLQRHPRTRTTSRSAATSRHPLSVCCGGEGVQGVGGRDPVSTLLICIPPQSNPTQCNNLPALAHRHHAAAGCRDQGPCF